MKRKLLIVLCCLLAFGCKKNEKVSAKEPISAATKNVSANVNLTDGTYNWFINTDEVGSSVTNFENTENLLRFSLTREVEIAEEEKWTWSEVMMDSTNSDWTKFSGLEITYKADKNLRVILMDSELEESDAAAGFWVVLPITENDTTITLNLENFQQHDWVFEQFPDIRKTIDNSKLYGIKIGTKAMGETTNATISKFILKSVISK